MQTCAEVSLPKVPLWVREHYNLQPCTSEGMVKLICQYNSKINYVVDVENTPAQRAWNAARNHMKSCDRRRADQMPMQHVVPVAQDGQRHGQCSAAAVTFKVGKAINMQKTQPNQPEFSVLLNSQSLHCQAGSSVQRGCGPDAIPLPMETQGQDQLPSQTPGSPLAVTNGILPQNQQSPGQPPLQGGEQLDVTALHTGYSPTTFSMQAPSPQSSRSQGAYNVVLHCQPTPHTPALTTGQLLQMQGEHQQNPSQMQQRGAQDIEHSAAQSVSPLQPVQLTWSGQPSNSNSLRTVGGKRASIGQAISSFTKRAAARQNYNYSRDPSYQASPQQQLEHPITVYQPQAFIMGASDQRLALPTQQTEQVTELATGVRQTTPQGQTALADRTQQINQAGQERGDSQTPNSSMSYYMSPQQQQQGLHQQLGPIVQENLDEQPAVLQNPVIMPVQDFEGETKYEYYMSRLREAVDPGHRCNGHRVAELVYHMMQWRANHTVTNVAFEKMMKILTFGLLRGDVSTNPEQSDHNLPPSRYMFDRLIGTASQDSMEWHQCMCGQYAWPPYSGKLHKLKNHTCPQCGAARVTWHSKSRKYKHAQKPFWYFGVQNAIQNYLFANPEWSAYRGTNIARQNTWYNSEFATDLRSSQYCGEHVLDSRHNSAYVIGCDWFQPFQKKQYSIGVIFLKSMDMEDRYQSINQNIVPLMIIPGPREPEKMEPYLHIIVDEFVKYGPQSEGFTVKAAHTGEEFAHKIILGGLIGDTPARTKLANLAGHSARLGCPYCVLNGRACWGYAKQTAYWPGFNVPVLCDLQQVKQLPRNHMAKCGSQSITCSNEDILRKGLLAEACGGLLPQPNPYGAQGTCVFVEKLQYFQLIDSLVLPVSHSMLRGIGYDLCNYLFQPQLYKPKQPPKRFHTRAATEDEIAAGLVPNPQCRTDGQAGMQGSSSGMQTARRGRGGRGGRTGPGRLPRVVTSLETETSQQARLDFENGRPPDYDTRVWYNGPLISATDAQLIQARGARLVTNCDQASTYEDIVKLNGKLSTMEEMLCFYDAYAPLLMRDVLLGGNAEFTTVVMKLFAAIAFFCRPVVMDENYNDTAKRYYNDIVAYAKYIEANGLPQKLLKINLHLVVCRLLAQCKKRGHIGCENELWIERAILMLKRICRGRTTADPEKVIVNSMLTKIACLLFKGLYACGSFEELTGSGQQREIYEHDKGQVQGDDKPERENTYYRQNNSWTGQTYVHRFVNYGLKLQFLKTTGRDKILSAQDKQLIPAAVARQMRWEYNQRLHNLKDNLRVWFEDNHSCQDLVTLYSGALVGMTEKVLSMGATETGKQSYWVVVNVRLRGTQQRVEMIASISKFVLARVDDPTKLTVDQNPPPYRAALAVVYQTQLVQGNGYAIYRADTSQPAQILGPDPIFLQWPGQTSPKPHHVINLDYIVQKVVHVSDDEDPNVLWCNTHNNISGQAYD